MSEPAGQQTEAFSFTLDRYVEFLESLRTAGYDFRSFQGEHTADSVLLRHDVDLSVVSALRMAQAEAQLGVESTYHILLTSPLYNPFEAVTRERIREIESLGHDIALHFSTHAYWDDERPAEESVLRARIEAERTALATLLEADIAPAVSFHIPPDWVLDRSLSGVLSTYAPEYFSDIGYIADSGQRWRSQPPVPEDLPERVQILTHPGMWGASDAEFEECVDRAIDATTSHTRDAAKREFIQGVYS